MKDIKVTLLPSSENYAAQRARNFDFLRALIAKAEAWKAQQKQKEEKAA